MSGWVKYLLKPYNFPRDICRVLAQVYLTKYDVAILAMACNKKLYLYTMHIDEDLFAQYCVKHGYLHLLKWSMVPLKGHITEYASKGGQLEMLKYLIVQKCDITRRTLGFAAANGHLHILQHFLETKELKEYFNVVTLHNMIIHGNVHHLQWLCSVYMLHKFRLNQECVLFASKTNHLDCMEYLLQQGFDVDVHRTVAQAKDVDRVIELLHVYNYV